jgi:hypothetical protein
VAEEAPLNVAAARTSSGDVVPPKCSVIEVHVPELKRLFNAIDPSPFRERDLDPKAEEFIVGWAKDIPTDAQLAFVVHLDRPAGLADEGVILRDAIHEYFRRQAEATRRRLRELLRRGRTSLAIGIVFLAGLILIGNLLSKRLPTGVSDIVRESLLIGGWVAMWRPLEVFLYDWWPVRNEARIYDRLAMMPVQIKYVLGAPAAPEAWRSDWPAAPLAEERSHRPN